MGYEPIAAAMGYAPVPDGLADGWLADGWGDGLPPRLGGRTYGGCDGTVTGWLGVVTETFAVAVPPLCWPTMVKYSAGPVPLGMT